MVLKQNFEAKHMRCIGRVKLRSVMCQEMKAAEWAMSWKPDVVTMLKFDLWRRRNVI